MDVLVVESPAKAKTIGKYLGPGFTVLASYGPCPRPAAQGRLGPPGRGLRHGLAGRCPRRRSSVDAIAKAVTKGGKLYLATDPDREGEAISWHVRDDARPRRRR